MKPDNYYLLRIVEEYKSFLYEEKDEILLCKEDILNILKNITQILEKYNFKNKSIIAKGKIYPKNDFEKNIIKNSKKSLYKEKNISVLNYKNITIIFNVEERNYDVKDFVMNIDFVINFSIYSPMINKKYSKLVYKNTK